MANEKYTAAASINFNVEGATESVNEIDKINGGFNEGKAAFVEFKSAATDATAALVQGNKAADESTKGLISSLIEARKATKALAEEPRSTQQVGTYDNLRAGLFTDNSPAARLGREAKPKDSLFDLNSLDAGLSQASILSRSLGNSQLGETLGTGADIASAIDVIPKFSQGIKEIGSTLVQTTGLTGKFAASGANLLGVLGPTAAGFGAIAAVVAPLAIALGLVAVGVTAYNNSLEEQNKALASATTSLNSYYQAIQSGTSDTIEKQIEALKKQKAAADAEAKTIENALSGGFEAAKAKAGGSDLLGKALFGIAQASSGELRGLQDRLNELKKQSTDTEAQLNGLNGALDSTEVAAADLAELQKKQTAAQVQYIKDTAQIELNAQNLIRTGSSEGVKDRLASIAAERESIKKQLADLSNLKAGGEDVTASVNALAVQYNNLTTEQDKLTNSVLPLVEAREREKKAAEELKKIVSDNAGELKNLAAQIGDLTSAREKALKRQAEQDQIDGQRSIIEDAYTNNIKFAREQERQGQYDQKIAKIRSDADKAEADIKATVRKADLAATAAQGEQIAKLNKQHMQNELKAVESYRKQVEAADEQHKEARLKILKSMYDSMFDAAANNDVVAFLNAQKTGQDSLTEEDKRADKEAKQRDQAFIDDSNARQQQYAEQLGDLIEEGRKQKEERDRAAKEQIDQLHAQLEERLKVESEANEKKYTEADRLEAELSRLREQWRKQDIERARNLEAEDYNERLQMLVNHENSVISILAASYSGQQEIIAQFGANAQQIIRNALIDTASATLNTTFNSSTAQISARLAGYGPTQSYAFADGGVATSPTLGMLGERPGYGDIVIPFNKSEGINAALDRMTSGRSGGASYNIDMRGAFLTGGATQADLEAVRQAVTRAIVDGVQD